MGRSALILIAALSAACPTTGTNQQSCQPDGGAVCGVAASDTALYPACAAGTSCFNRNCMPTCAGGCAAGTYCANGVCVPNSVTSCGTNNCNCPLGQFCLYGHCVSQNLRADGGYQACIPNAAPDDACASGVMCYTLINAAGTGTVNTCVGMPPCSADGGCPTGSSFGSICNEGRNPDGGQIFAGKGRICLFSYCMIDSDCDKTAHCFYGKPTLVGRCTYGVTGDQCFTNADCFGSSGVCSGADGGLNDGGIPGFCQ